jgi:heme/copper-type cytochrome/quinol oxidase subunit 2
MPSSLADKIAAKLKKENITPKPKWQFLLRDYLLWSVFGINVLLGAMFFVVTSFSLRDNDWDIYKHLDQNFLEYIIMTMPYIRITALVVFIFLAYYNYKHTDRGYKYKTHWIIIMSVVVMGLIGGTLLLVGAEAKIERLFSRSLPFYDNLEERRIRVWHHPGKGLLGGEIVEINMDSEIVLQDCHNKNWQVDVQEVIWRGPIGKPEMGRRIKVIGEQLGEDKFKAKEVRPWMGGRRMRHREEYEDEQRGEYRKEHRGRYESKKEYDEIE